MRISKRAFDLCVGHEVTSKAYYEKHYMRPEWPGLQSGPTVGIGYDLGQASRSKIVADWTGLVSGDMLLAMASCAGYTGEAGRSKTAAVKNQISIPWDAALKVFETRDVPQWTAGVLQRVPGAEKLPPSCLGVLFDIAYNRGHSWSKPGNRYDEMREIRRLVGAGEWSKVPAQIRSMKRLWPGVAGLLRRCEDRAKLWEYGLTPAGRAEPELVAALTPPAPDAAVPQNAGPARTAPPVTTPSQNTTAIVVAAGGAAGAAGAANAGLVGGATAVGIALAAALLGGLVWYVWHRNRNPK
jgi:hypothetical protein